jgi:hypothetical protein
MSQTQQDVVVLLCYPVAEIGSRRHSSHWLLHRDGKRYVAAVAAKQGVALETEEQFAACRGSIRAIARLNRVGYRSHLGEHVSCHKQMQKHPCRYLKFNNNNNKL